MTQPDTKFICAADLPAMEAQAAVQGRVLDHWPLFDGCTDLIAVRFVATGEERDEANAYRYLGLVPPQR